MNYLKFMSVNHIGFTKKAMNPAWYMAERQGFEPWVRFYPHNRLAGGCLQPTRPPLPKKLYYQLY